MNGKLIGAITTLITIGICSGIYMLGVSYGFDDGREQGRAEGIVSTANIIKRHCKEQIPFPLDEDENGNWGEPYFCAPMRQIVPLDEYNSRRGKSQGGYIPQSEFLI